MSPELFSLITVVFIHTITVESSVNQTLCFPAEDGIDATDFWALYQDSIDSLTLNQIIVSETPQCEPTTLSDINNDLHACFRCSFDITTDPETDLEELRYTTLSLINTNMDVFIQDIQDQIRGFSTLAYITYASADYADVNPRCISMAYPRICRFDLAAVSKSGPENLKGDTYYFSLAMDTTTETLQYEMSYSTVVDGPNNWFGLGFGTTGMSGDAAIYTCGEFNCVTPTVTDYYLEIIGGQRSASGVQSDETRGGTDDFTDYTTSNVDGEFSVSFNRAFDTGDEWDLVFDGTETSLDVFASVGTGTLVLGAHGVSNSVPSVNALFVPSPQETDIEWCGNAVVQSCIKAVEPIIPTTDPTADPTLDPTDLPTIDPTNYPSEIPSASPSKHPTETPIVSLTVPGTTTSSAVDTIMPTDSANTYGIVMVFVVVIVMLCSN